MVKSKDEGPQDGVYVDARANKGSMKMLFFERQSHKLVLSEAGFAYIVKMTSMGCTIDDIADELGVSKQTLYTKHNRPKLDEAVKIGQGRLKNSLRMAQVKTAVKGNPTMLIFLGKNYLGQSDNPLQVKDDVSPMEEFAKAFTEQENRLEREASDEDTSTEQP